MNRSGRVLVSLGLVGAMLGGVGCVRSGTYQALKKELEDVRVQYETEKVRAQDLRAENRRLKQDVTDLDTKFRTWREQLARTEQEWKATRDELLRMRIEREQQRSAPRDVVVPSRFRLLPEVSRPESEASLQTEQSTEMKRRLSELRGVLQQIQHLLEP